MNGDLLKSLNGKLFPISVIKYHCEKNEPLLFLLPYSPEMNLIEELWGCKIIFYVFKPSNS